MAGLVPPVVVALVADTKEFNAKVDQSMGKMEEMGGIADKSGSKWSNFANKASTAVIGAGVAIAAYGVDKAMKFQEALDNLQNTTNVTADTLKKISKSAIDISNTTTSSATDVIGAYKAAAAAGYGWAKSQDVVRASSKLAQISGNDITSTTQALIAAQNLGITKGMSSAKVADLLTIALKGNESGLSGVVSLLQGKVGSAFAAYHQSAGEAVAVANEFSLAGITQTRQIATFVNKLGALQGPMQTVSVSNGKLTTSSAGYVNALVGVGLNVDKTRMAFSGPNGLINGLKYLKTTADGSLPQLQRYLTAIFGATGVGGGMALINNLDKITKTIHAANAASSGGLNTAFNISQSNIDNKMKELKNQFENILQGVGMFLLPSITDLANWTEDAVKFFKAHPLLEKIASDAAIGLFAGAVALKISNGIRSIWGSINSQVQTGLLQTIATNTTTIATEGGVGRGGVGGATTATEDVGKLSIVASSVQLAAGGFAGYELFRHLRSDQTNLASTYSTAASHIGSKGGTNKPPFKGAVLEVVGTGSDASTMWVTAAQLKQYDAALSASRGGGHRTTHHHGTRDKPKGTLTINHHHQIGFR